MLLSPPAEAQDRFTDVMRELFELRAGARTSGHAGQRGRGAAAQRGVAATVAGDTAGLR